MIVKEENPVLLDVICQHKSDGGLIPLKIRVKDEDGATQVFVIKAYKEILHPGESGGGKITTAMGHLWQFECKIHLFQTEKKVMLFFNAYDNLWKLTFPDGK